MGNMKKRVHGTRENPGLHFAVLGYTRNRAVIAQTAMDVMASRKMKDPMISHQSKGLCSRDIHFKDE